MNNSVLKKAFTEAQLGLPASGTHKFSHEFEKRMEKLIRMQNGVYRLINTTGKRAACIVLAVILSFTAVACGVKEVREPLVREIKRIFVNARELFDGTPAEDISSLLPSEIEKIVAADHTDKNGAEYTIDNPEKIKSFIKIMTDTAWYKPQDETEDFEFNSYWSFEFYSAGGECLSRLDMCRSFSNDSTVIIQKNGEKHIFRISDKVYSELLCFTNKKYYLHNSSLPFPGEEFCAETEKRITADLNREDKKRVEREIRDAHYAVESFLLQNVSLLKSQNSVYWDCLESNEGFLDPITNEKTEFDVNKRVKSALSYVIFKVTDRESCKTLKKALDIWERGVREHNLDDLFLAHEYIHDYDYFAINYPTHYVYDNSADYQGLDDYFGRIGDNS